MLPEGPIPYTRIEFLGNDGSKPLVAEGPKIVTRYEYLEDECEGNLELKGPTTLVYTGLIRETVKVDGILVSTKVTYMTLELVNIPIERIMREYAAYQASTSGIPKH